MMSMKEAFAKARVLIDESGEVARTMMAEAPTSPEGDPPLDPEVPEEPVVPVPEPENVQ